MIDVAKKNGVVIDYDALSRQTGVVVVPMNARVGKGKAAFLESLAQARSSDVLRNAYPDALQQGINTIAEFIAPESYETPEAKWRAGWLLETGFSEDEAQKVQIQKVQDHVAELCGTEANLAMANARFGLLNQCIEQAVENKKTFAQMRPSEKNKISHRGMALQKLKEFLLKTL